MLLNYVIVRILTYSFSVMKTVNAVLCTTGINYCGWNPLNRVTQAICVRDAIQRVRWNGCDVQGSWMLSIASAHCATAIQHSLAH